MEWTQQTLITDLTNVTLLGVQGLTPCRVAPADIGSGSVEWEAIQGVPTTFPPEAHTHPEYETPIKSLTPYNDVVIEYLDSANINIIASGKFTDEDNTIHTIPETVMLNITTGLTSNETLTAETWYYVYGGLNSNGELTFVLSAGETLPVELVHGRNLHIGLSIYNDAGTLKIRPFSLYGPTYRYHSPILLFSGTLPTTQTPLSLSAYCPASTQLGCLLGRGDRVDIGWNQQNAWAAFYVILDSTQYLVWYMINTASSPAYQIFRMTTTNIPLRRSFAIQATTAHQNSLVWLPSFQLNRV